MPDIIDQINLDRIFKAKLISFEDVALDVRKFTFRPEKQFLFKPWQYIWLEIPNMTFADVHGNRRAFSIFNTYDPDTNLIQIVARSGPSGYKQSLFSLSPGTEVTLHGPFGNSFIVDENSTQNIIMIAGGIGVVGFIRIIQTIKNLNLPIKCFLVYINKSEEVTPFLPELAAYKNSYPFFDYKVSYTHFTWEDVRQKISEFGNNYRIWIAGPQPMINASYNVLKDAGIPEIKMEFENFYPTPVHNLTHEDIIKQLQNNIFAKALENSTNHTIITDSNGVVLFANKASQKITGYSEQEMLGNTPRLWGGMMSKEFYVNLWKRKREGYEIRDEIINRRKNGEVYHAIAHISRILDDQGEIIGYIGTEEDITDRVNAEDKIKENNIELQKLNDAMVGRELKMIELKEQIEKLKNP